MARGRGCASGGRARGLGRLLAPGTPEAQIAGWVRERIASGHGADPDQAARLILRLTAGRGDRLSGRHLTVTDDLDALLARIDQIQREDLHTLRLRH